MNELAKVAKTRTCERLLAEDLEKWGVDVLSDVMDDPGRNSVKREGQ